MFLRVVVLCVLFLTVYENEGREVSIKCIQDAGEVILAAQNNELWALHMLDASTKIPDGLLFGNVDQLGNYEECVNARSQDFQGFYCRVAMQITTPQNMFKISLPDKKINPQVMTREGPELFIRAAVCTPSSCAPDDVQQLVEEFAPQLLASITGGIAPNVSAFVDPAYCMIADSGKTVSLTSWMLTAVFVLIIAVMVTAAIVDSWGTSSRIKDHSSLLFTISARNVITQLFSLRSDSGNLSCLHGLRVLSMAWIILGHRFEALFYTPLSNITNALDTFMRRPTSMTILNALIAVDTFFFLSGLLICFVFFREMKKYNKFNLFNFYAFRFLRLMVPMAVVVIFYAFFLTYVGDGPNWEGVIGFLYVSFCQENWWRTILYVNNYIEPLQPCISQTWYTSVDMQLAWFSPLVLVPLYYAPRVGQQLLALFIAISCFIPFTLTYLNNYPWNSIILEQNYFDLNSFLIDLYLPTHTRATPYLVGMLVGYYVFKTYNKSLKLSKSVVIFGWLLSTTTALTIIYTFAIPHQIDYVYEPVAAAFYAGFHRLGWTLVLAWIVISCSKGYGGPVNVILSWSGFQPLSKLSYAAYLTHVVVINANVATSRATEFYSFYDIIHSYFGDLPIILCTSMLLYIFIEAPLIVFLHRTFREAQSNKSTASRQNADGS